MITVLVIQPIETDHSLMMVGIEVLTKIKIIDNIYSIIQTNTEVKLKFFQPKHKVDNIYFSYVK